jgi:FkbM family methyltransferase
MYQAHGWWFADQDTHFAHMIDKNIKKGGPPTYQEPVRAKSLEFVKDFGVAIDIGANVGLWSRDLVRKFAHVIAIEPVVDFQECLRRNVPMENIEIWPIALGTEDTLIDMIITEGNTGHSHIDKDTVGTGKVEMKQLDSLTFDRIDYMKIDCEGYEMQILKGGEHTICTHQPVIVVEQKLHTDTGITKETQYGCVQLLKTWGARELGRVRNDCILGW